jgi:uncharacterized RDD family membrane protein YckC
MSAIEKEIGSQRVGALAAPVTFAGPWRRLSGWVIDYLIVVILAIIPVGLLAGSAGGPASAVGSLRGAGVFLGVWLGYSIVFAHTSGETIGRIAVGIRVVDLRDGRPPSWGRATIRALFQLGLFLLLVVPILAALNYARVLWDARKQGWHDRAARTIVVRTRGVAAPEAAADASLPAEALPAAAGWTPPPPTPLSRGRRAWIVALTILGVVGLSGLYFVGLYGYLEDDLVDADFGTASEPFEVGEDGAATYEVVEGTYRITLNRQGAWALTLGELRRRAYAIGVQADLLEVTQPGVLVGVGCVGDTPDGEGLAGYLFAVAPGGDFTLLRDGLSVREGSDPRIETVRRLSVICAPGVGDDVFVVGLANGLEIVRFEDASGLAGYTYAMLGVRGERGAEVRFTSVWSRVPDERWLSGTEPRDVPPQAAGSFAEKGVSFQHPWEWSVREIRAPLAAGSNVGLSIAIEPPGGLYRHEYLRINASASDGATAGEIATERLDALARDGGTLEGPTATSLGGSPAFEGRIVDHRLADRPFEIRIVVLVVAGTTAYEILCQYEPDDAEIIAGCERVVDSFGFPDAQS